MWYIIYNISQIKKEKIKYVDVSLLDDISKEIKKLKETNIELEKQIKELTNTNYDEITDKETADLVLNILDTYFTSFDSLDLNTKRNMIKLLVSSITTDGEDITINFLGARNVKDKTFPTGESRKCNIHVLEIDVSISKLFDKLKDKLDTEVTLRIYAV